MATNAVTFDCPQGHPVSSVEWRVCKMASAFFCAHHQVHSVLQSEQQQADQNGEISLPSKFIAIYFYHL